MVCFSFRRPTCIGNKYKTKKKTVGILLQALKGPFNPLYNICPTVLYSWWSLYLTLENDDVVPLRRVVYVSPVSHHEQEFIYIHSRRQRNVLHWKGDRKSFHKVTMFCPFLIYFLSPMPFHINHTFSLHDARSSQISVLSVDKNGSKTCQIHFTRLSSCSYHNMKLKFSHV